MKPKKEDEKVKRKQASEAIKKADIESEMLSKRDDRPVAVAKPAMVRPMVKPPVASNPAMDEMRNADLQRQMANQGRIGPRALRRPGMESDISESPDSSMVKGQVGVLERNGGPIKDKAKSKSTCMKSGGMVKSSASRGDGIAQRGKTRGRIC